MPHPHETPEQTARVQVLGALRAALRGQASPRLQTPRAVVPAASLWTGAALWDRRLASLGLASGDRVVVALPPGPAFLMALLGCWRRGAAACPLDLADPLAQNPDAALDAFDARLHVAETDHPASLAPDPAGAPRASATVARDAGEPAPDLALILSTSGSGGPPKRVALTWANVHAQLASHTPALAIAREEVVLSALPWRHAFGLLVDLLPALLSGATVTLESSGGRDPSSIIDAATRHGAARLSLVPLQLRRLLETPAGETVLANLNGGVVGGAPIRADLAGALAGARLRAGYGLTEASPGVCLGAPGEWREGWLGRPLACHTRVSEDGELLVRGPNVCAGRWSSRRLERQPRDRWLATGDVVEQAGDGFVHLGRTDHRFKLENGRLIDAPAIERQVRAALPPGSEIVVTTEDHRRLLARVSPGAAAALRRAWPADLPPPLVEERILELTPKGEPARAERKIIAEAAA